MFPALDARSIADVEVKTISGENLVCRPVAHPVLTFPHKVVRSPEVGGPVE
jgi:hypothetical protein